MTGWKIRDKITGLLLLYFMVAVVAIGSTLFVSWQLEGGAAAINDAGSERMRSYRIAFLIARHVQQPSAALRSEIAREVGIFEMTLDALEKGDPLRPLSLPQTPAIREQMAKLRQGWQQEIKPRIARLQGERTQAGELQLLSEYQNALQRFVGDVNDLVLMVEHANARATALLRSFQVGLVSLALLGTVLLLYLFSRMVVRPVTTLKDGIQRMAKADFSVRLPVTSRDELGDLAEGFNRMADELQGLYATLEQRVEEKTRSIEMKNRELAALYDVAAFLNSTTTEPLCAHVLAKMVALFGARGGVVRLCDQNGEVLSIVASQGVSDGLLSEEATLGLCDCLCGASAHEDVPVSCDFTRPPSRPLLGVCRKEGFSAMVAVPLRSKQRVLGVLNLFFEEPRTLPQAEVRLLESVGQHLGIAIENQRLVAREKEMAVSEERNLLAQELHDSIAQSLAFLNIQVQLLQEDLQNERINTALEGLSQIREGIQESYDDVRELLVHFRTRIDHADLETAMRSALEKFEGQTGIGTTFSCHGVVPILPPEQVLQITHILQESLSNVRKHAHASRVDVEMVSNGQCVLSIQDNGIGFDAEHDAGDTHVGLRIMRERAHRIGGELMLHSAPGKGTRVCLALASTAATPSLHA